MTRAAFNTLCDVFSGSGTVSPWTYKGTFLCRLVLEDGVHVIGSHRPNITHYLTLEGLLPDDCFVADLVVTDPWKADQIVVVDSPDQYYWVFLTDQIIWGGQTPYYRAYLVPGLLGRELSAGGWLLGGSAAIAFTPGETFSGGWKIGGSAVCIFGPNVLGSGGWKIGGAAATNFVSGLIWKDTFTDITGTNLEAHVPEIGTGYTKTGAQMKIGFNLATTNNLVGAQTAQYEFTPSQPTFDLRVHFMMADTTQYNGFRFMQWYFRYANGANSIQVNVIFGTGQNTITSFHIVERVGGTITQQVFPAATMNTLTDYEMRVQLSATAISVTINGVSGGFSTTAGASVAKVNFSFSQTFGGYVQPYINDLFITQ